MWLQLVLLGLVQDPPPPPPLEPPPSKYPIYEGKLQLQAEGKIEEVTGADDRSSLQRGAHIYTEERSVSQWTLEGNRTLEIILASRATDDIRTDPEKFSLTTFTVTYKTPQLIGVAGDFGASFAPYSLIGAFKGLYGEWRGGQARIKALAGTNKPQWRMFAESVDNEPMDRFFQGIRFELSSRQQAVSGGVSLVHARDLPWTVDQITPASPIDNWTLGADVRVRISEHFAFRAEAAGAQQDPDIDEAPGYEKGHAARLETEFRVESFRWTTLFETVSPQFVSAAGSAAPDRDTAKTNYSWDVARFLNLSGGYARMRETIVSNGTHAAWVDEIDLRFRVHRIPGLDMWSARGGYRIRMTQTNDHGGEQNVHTGEFGIHRDWRWFRGGIDLGLRHTDGFDPGTTQSETRTAALTGGFPVDWIYGGSALGFRYSREETYGRPSANDSFIDSGTATLSIRTPIPLSAVLAYSYLQSDRRTAGADAVTQIGRFDLRYDFAGSGRAWISFSLEIRDNAFETAGQDYQEQIYSIRGFIEW
jgi:hypothetical protein